MGHNSIHKISDAEWKIMHVIWEKSPLYMGDIVKALKESPWSRTTIQTMVLRLLSKEVIGTNREGHAFLYYPQITKQQALDKYLKDFVSRVYQDDSKSLVEEIIDAGLLSSSDKKDIKKLL